MGPLLNPSEKTPNLVLVVMEGFGHAYTSPSGYIGNFAPFLDSLAGKSLYWENALSSTGRTFGALPTLTGSLPFGNNGFLEINETPPHFNLFNVLKKNGFSTGFFYGGDAGFDKMYRYLEYSRTDRIVDQSSFSSPYRKLPSKKGTSWGYEDQSVFTKMLDMQPVGEVPYFNTLFTLSTHSPFLINNTAHYEKRYKQVMASGKLSGPQKHWAGKHKKQLTAVLNGDDALRGFFSKYRQRPDFENTIFIITGDHSMPEILLQSKIDRFHVPLVIYSPLIKEPKRYKPTVSHFDVAPSVLAYYRNNYNMKTPKTVAWVGSGLQGGSDKVTAGIPIMKSKDQLYNYVYGNYHLEENQLFYLTGLEEDPIADGKELDRVEAHFNNFKAMNARFNSVKKLMPDSVLVKFFK